MINLKDLPCEGRHEFISFRGSKGWICIHCGTRRTSRRAKFCGSTVVRSTVAASSTTLQRLREPVREPRRADGLEAGRMGPHGT